MVGEENAGLRCMFTMMNAMRIEVGLGAAALGKRGFLESLLYAQVFFSPRPSGMLRPLTIQGIPEQSCVTIGLTSLNLNGNRNASRGGGK